MCGCKGGDSLVITRKLVFPVPEDDPNFVTAVYRGGAYMHDIHSVTGVLWREYGIPMYGHNKSGATFRVHQHDLAKQPTLWQVVKAELPEEEETIPPADPPPETSQKRRTTRKATKEEVD